MHAGQQGHINSTNRCPLNARVQIELSTFLMISHPGYSLHHLLPPPRPYANSKISGHLYELTKCSSDLHKGSYIVHTIIFFHMIVTYFLFHICCLFYFAFMFLFYDRCLSYLNKSLLSYLLSLTYSLTYLLTTIA